MISYLSPKDVDLPEAVHRDSRYALGLSFIVIFVALFFGRYLETNFPILITAVKYFGITLAIFAVYYLSKTLLIARNAFQDAKKRKKIYTLFILSIVILLFGAFLCETFVSYPIERVHFIKYSLVGTFAFYAQKNRSFGKNLLYSVLAAIVISCSEEGLQYFVPNRIFDINDIILNVISGLYSGYLSWISYLWIYLIQSAPEKPIS